MIRIRTTSVHLYINDIANVSNIFKINLFADDIANVSNRFKVNLFADDTSVFHTHANFESLIKETNQ